LRYRKPLSTVADPTRAIRVLCVDDLADVTTVIRLMIEAEVGSSRMECVGCLSSADHLVDEVRRIGGTDVVLLDATMTGLNPFEAMSELARQFPQTRTIIFSGHHDQAFIDRAMDAGAWGCLSKNDPPEQIMQAVREVASGRTFFSRLRHPRLKTA
jgi:DNA-binding NarL/FixJ family response regulator